MLKIPKPLGAFHSFKQIPSQLLFFFSLLNCKYQVPFILLFLLLLYCCSCNYFFFSSRPAQQWRDCYFSIAVCKYNFISVPGSGGKTEQNVSFLFSLPPLHSLLFPCFPIKVVMTALFIVLYLWGSWFLFHFYLQQKT